MGFERKLLRTMPKISIDKVLSLHYLSKARELQNVSSLSSYLGATGGSFAFSLILACLPDR